MRKRLVIGLIALVVLGGAVYLFSQPRRGGVDYHKEQFVKENRVGTARDKWILAHAPDFVAELYVSRRVKRAEFHRDALIKFGYLEEREFLFTNRSAIEWWESPQKGEITSDFTDVVRVTTNKIIILAPREDMPRWEKLLRQVDAPPN
jgi:type II secretory pathway component GspD/PulD (secretin)